MRVTRWESTSRSFGPSSRSSCASDEKNWGSFVLLAKASGCEAKCAWTDVVPQRGAPISIALGSVIRPRRSDLRPDRRYELLPGSLRIRDCLSWHGGDVRA